MSKKEIGMLRANLVHMYGLMSPEAYFSELGLFEEALLTTLQTEVDKLDRHVYGGSWKEPVIWVQKSEVEAIINKLRGHSEQL